MEQQFSQTVGMVFWMTGLSGAGKTSLAQAVAARLRERGLPVVVLDGDIMRRGLCADLGFSERDRQENNRRCAETAKLLAIEAGQLCIGAFISPLESMRQRVRHIIGAKRFRLIFVDCDLEICARRDPKGNYAKARLGIIPGYTGLGAPYEPPSAPDVTISTGAEALETSTDRLLAYILTQVQSETEG